MTTEAAPPPRSSGPLLPQRGVARVKNVLSGDTVVLLGKAAPGQPAPEVVFTFERVTAPRMASRANRNRDDPGAFPSREFLRLLCVGKNVSFETRSSAPNNKSKDGGSKGGDRVYGVLLLPNPSGDGSQLNLAVEAVRNGHATPKVFGGQAKYTADNDLEGGDISRSNSHAEEANAYAQDPSVLVPPPGYNNNSNSNSTANSTNEDPTARYERQLTEAYSAARQRRLNVHSASPLVRSIKNAGDDFKTRQLVARVHQYCGEGGHGGQGGHGGSGRVRCVVEHIFDGSRFRCQIVGPLPPMGPGRADLLHGSFTLILAGVASPRMGNPRADPPTADEAFAVDARDFVSTRLLHRELEMTLYGTDRAGVCAVGTVHHPRGNIAVELLKAGLARVSDWSARMMDPEEVPAFRVAENNAKRANFGVWHSYEAPQISGASEIRGVVVEALTGDTVNVLPAGVPYDDEARLKKVSLASVRAPRAGNDKFGKPDDPYANECRDRLRQLTVGRPVDVTIHYEREIPMGPRVGPENRQFGTISVRGRQSDVGRVLISEGLATTQRHRDDEEKSPRYDDLIAAESVAVAAKKGVHDPDNYQKSTVDDLTNPQKAKAYADTLIRAGNIKAVVEYCFNGSRFKLFVPSENVSIVFALSCLRAPQASPMPGAKIQTKPEPFGDDCKRRSRLTILQRNVEIRCTGVTLGGVITGELWVGQGGQRRNFSVELVSAGLCSVDQRKIDYGEASQEVIEAQKVAQANKAGVWSIERSEETVGGGGPASPTSARAVEQIKTVQLSEICSGNHFYYTVIGDETSGLIEESMRLFTANNGTTGAPCDVRKNKIVAALFDGSWYRARILEKKGIKASVLYVDHGNMNSVPIATHLRPLDESLGTDKIPAVAKEAYLALTEVRSLDDDDGHDAATMLQRIAWGKPVNARIFCDIDGKAQVALMDPTSSSSINEQLIAAGLARKSKQFKIYSIENRMVDGSIINSFAAGLTVSQDAARRSRTGMWRYGDVGEDDEEDR